MVRYCFTLKLMKDHLNSKLGMKTYKEYSARIDNYGRNSSHTGKFSHFRRNYHAGNCNGGHSQNGPHNHWNNGPQNRGPRYNAQGDYLTNKQKQLCTVFNQLLKIIQ